jgi:hypothetical protein
LEVLADNEYSNTFSLKKRTLLQQLTVAEDQTRAVFIAKTVFLGANLIINGFHFNQNMFMMRRKFPRQSLQEKLIGKCFPQTQKSTVQNVFTVSPQVPVFGLQGTAPVVL